MCTSQWVSRTWRINDRWIDSVAFFVDVITPRFTKRVQKQTGVVCLHKVHGFAICEWADEVWIWRVKFNSPGTTYLHSWKHSNIDFTSTIANAPVVRLKFKSTYLSKVPMESSKSKAHWETKSERRHLHFFWASMGQHVVGSESGLADYSQTTQSASMSGSITLLEWFLEHIH